MTYEEAEKIANGVWDVIEDSASYGFNSPHSLATALDSLYMAYLKTQYPEETYAVLLEYYLLGKKRNIGKVSQCKKELEDIGYNLAPIAFGQDNRTFLLNDRTFTQSAMSMKSSNPVLAEVMYDLSTESNSYIQIYSKMKIPKKESTNRAYLTKTHWRILCQANYFPGQNNRKLEEYIPLLYDKVFTKKQFTLKTLKKLEETLGMSIDLTNYISRKTAKTFYLDPEKIESLVCDLYDKISCREYTVREVVENQIKVFGFLSEPEQYLENGIFTGKVNAVSRKNKSVLIKTLSGKDTWVGIEGDITAISKKETIVIFSVKRVKRFKKDALVATDYLTYK